MRAKTVMLLIAILGLLSFIAVPKVVYADTLDNVVKVTSQLSPVLGILVTIIVLLALPILVFRVLVGEVLSKI
jgi:hypothetical protein